jgi:hypothetical protein
MTQVNREDINSFVGKLNNWVISHNPDQLPKMINGQLAQFRLPTEPEWEFAARGGLPAMQQGLFEAKNPYGVNPGRYENFRNENNLSSQLNEVGRLDPNPLGLFDMLGNVRQIVYESPAGGTVSIERGAAFSDDDPSLVSASTRVVQPVATRRDSVGFRLVLGADLSQGRYAYFVQTGAASLAEADNQATPAPAAPSPVEAQPKPVPAPDLPPSPTPPPVQMALTFPSYGFRIEPLIDSSSRSGTICPLEMLSPSTGDIQTNVNVLIEDAYLDIKDSAANIVAGGNHVLSARSDGNSATVEFTDARGINHSYEKRMILPGGLRIVSATGTAPELFWQKKSRHLKACVDSLSLFSGGGTGLGFASYGFQINPLEWPRSSQFSPGDLVWLFLPDSDGFAKVSVFQFQGLSSLQEYIDACKEGCKVSGQSIVGEGESEGCHYIDTTIIVNGQTICSHMRLVRSPDGSLFVVTSSCSKEGLAKYGKQLDDCGRTLMPTR